MGYAPRPTIADDHPIVQLTGHHRVLGERHGDAATPVAGPHRERKFKKRNASHVAQSGGSGEAPTRFFAGISFGCAHVNEDDQRGATPVEREFDALSVGLDLGYSWLLGRTRQFFNGTGIGAKRLFPIGGNDDEEETYGYPTFRLSIWVRILEMQWLSPVPIYQVDELVVHRIRLRVAGADGGRGTMLQVIAQQLARGAAQGFVH